MTKQFYTSMIIAILNITFVLVEKGNTTESSFTELLCCPKNNIK